MLIIKFIMVSAAVYYFVINSPVKLWKELQEYRLLGPVQKVSTYSVLKTNGELERDHFLLVVLVLSRPSGKECRDAIRQTWIKGYRERAQGVLVKFSIGTEGISTQAMDNLTLEESIYGDLLLLPHLQDSYNNLTRKVLESYIEINKVYNFSYLLKCDDDTFVVLDTILSELARRGSKKGYYWGSMYRSALIRKTGKWTEMEWLLCDTYVPYAAGGCYILSQNLVTQIVSNSDVLKLFNNEDVSVGLWIVPYNIDRHHDSRFNLMKGHKCKSSDIVLHYQTKKDMILRQNSYDKHKFIC